MYKRQLFEAYNESVYSPESIENGKDENQKRPTVKEKELTDDKIFETIEERLNKEYSVSIVSKLPRCV